MLTHPVIGSGIAIALITFADWGNRGGSSVYISAIAAVTLEVIRDGLERASSLAGRSFLCERPVPPRPDAIRRLSGDEARVPGTDVSP